MKFWKSMTDLIFLGLVAVVAAVASVGSAAAQTILAQVPIPSTSAGGQVAANPALNLIYSAGGFTAGDTLTVIDGKTFAVVTTISNLNGVSVDLKNDNFWTTNLFGGQVLVYSGATNSQIGSLTVGFCPGEVTFDCKLRRMWAGAQCGGGNDPVFAFNADTFALIAGPIGTGGVMGPIMANPRTGKLYVTSSGVSKEVNPTTFAVTNTGFGTVLAVDSVTNRLFAQSGNNLQIINGATDSVIKTVALTYTPSVIGVNNALDHLYLGNQTAGTIEIRDDSTGSLLGTVPLGAGNFPGGNLTMAVDSTRGRFYAQVFNSSTSQQFIYAIEDLAAVRKCEIRGGC